MIKEIKLKNYILIDELSAVFNSGLNVITGETGAGKSIILNAIDLVFSARVSKEVIKTGADKAYIEITLENTNHNLSDFFEENGIDDLGSEIVITKEISQNSVRSRINGTLVNQELLKKLRSIFVDIHSQHQTYTFMQPQYHINLLDSYAKDVYGNLLYDYQTKFKSYEELKKELHHARETYQNTDSQKDFLQYQINEIEEANIKSETEDIELSNELEVLENVEKLKELTGSSYWTLNGDDGSILETLAKINFDLSKASKMDAKLEECCTVYTEAMEILKDTASYLRDYSQNLENDTQRLNEIQERIFLLDKLKRKYGTTLEGVLKTYSDLTLELSLIENSTNTLQTLEKQIAQIEAELKSTSSQLSAYRNDYAQVLSVLIQDCLTKLELPRTRFKIDVQPCELSINGADSVEFLISTNISEELKPLSKVASGGEISRVMLAIKSIFAQNDAIDTVIFDEIDTGISGHASRSVAEEIVCLSKSHQVFVITHQAIIASKADKHFYVKKSQDDETRVEVYVLNGENRIKALAELAGGEITDKSMEFAKSLLK